ncbi:MAG: hypothetical protein KBS81_03325 [Spirochaetales bacterium]|nr:hypothetical protein [Candidatus Physcosoma equi]
MKANRWNLLVLLFLILALFVSCDDKSEKNKAEDYEENCEILVEFNAPVIQSKNLVESYSFPEKSTIDYFAYKVEYKGTKEHYSNIPEGEWTTTTDYPHEWNVVLSQGPWTTTAKVHYQNGNYSKPYADESVFVNLNTVSIFDSFSSWFLSTGNTGSLRLADLYLPRLYQTNGDYRVHYEIKQVRGTTGFSSSSGDLVKVIPEDVGINALYDNGVVTFVPVEFLNVPEGYYSISIQTWEYNTFEKKETLVGGDIHIARVSRGAITTVSGNLNERPILSVPLRTFQNSTTFTGKIEKTKSRNDVYEFECIAERATGFKWYKNGAEMNCVSGSPEKMRCVCPNYTSAGLACSRSTYIDCVFTDSNGHISSSSIVIVNDGGLYNGDDDSSTFTFVNGNEIAKWDYSLDTTSQMKDTFKIYGISEGEDIAATINHPVSEGLWNIRATAYNSLGLKLGSNTVTRNGDTAYVNASNPYLSVKLEPDEENTIENKGWIEFRGMVISVLGFGGWYYNNTPIIDQSGIDYTIRKLDNDGAYTNDTPITGSLKVEKTIDNGDFRYTLPIKTMLVDPSQDVDERVEVQSGVYEISLEATVKMESSNVSQYTREKGNKGYLKIIVNVFQGTSVIVTGTLSCNEAYKSGTTSFVQN